METEMLTLQIHDQHGADLDFEVETIEEAHALLWREYRVDATSGGSVTWVLIDENDRIIDGTR